MGVLVKFPSSAIVDTSRNIPIENPKAPIVCDFGNFLVQATVRRRVSQELLSDLERASILSSYSLNSRESIGTFLMIVSVEELKHQRYHINYDVLMALSYIIQKITQALIEVVPSTFQVPEISAEQLPNTSVGEHAVLSYLFSPLHSSDLLLRQTKESIVKFYFHLADLIWSQLGRKGEDLEMLYDELARILPLILDIIKAYLVPFRKNVQNMVDMSGKTQE